MTKYYLHGRADFQKRHHPHPRGDRRAYLELKGESPFKSIAYANAARRLETLEEDLEELVRRGELTSIKGIGDALSKKITELVATGPSRLLR